MRVEIALRNEVTFLALRPTSLVSYTGIPVILWSDIATSFGRRNQIAENREAVIHSKSYILRATDVETTNFTTPSTE